MSYRKLFDDVPIGVYRTLGNGELSEVNPALAEILRYPTPAELPLRGAREGSDDDDRRGG